MKVHSKSITREDGTITSGRAFVEMSVFQAMTLQTGIKELKRMMPQDDELMHDHLDNILRGLDDILD